MNEDQRSSSLAARFRVVRLTADALLRQCRVDDFEEWGAPSMNLTQYLHREDQLMHSQFTRTCGSFWALVEREQRDGLTSQDDEELIVQDGERLPDLCVHCEVYSFECLLRKADGAIVRGYSYHIGSVFTLPSYRRQGLAAFFLKQIAAKTAALPDTIGSVLYSDIGPKYYDKLGWRCHESRMGSMYVADPKNAAAAELSVPSSSSKVEPLYLDAALDELLAKDRRLLEAELSDAQYADQEVFAPVATRGPIEWQFLTGVYHLALQGQNEASIKRCGLKLDDGAFIVWRHHPKDSVLYILRSRFPQKSPDACCTLLSAALHEARKFGLKCVKIWDPPSFLAQESVASRFQIEYQDRVSSLSSAMIFAQHRSASPSPPASLPVWLANEKFAWV